MPDLYDTLFQRMEPEEPGSGITPMDLMDLDSNQRSVMLMLLRDPNKADGVPREALEQRFLERMPDLYDTLRALSQRGWVIEMGEWPEVRYRANLRARRGHGGLGLWAFLNDVVQ